MWKEYIRICAKVNLDAIDYNIEMMKKNLKEGVQMMAVVKADGYGHGSVQVANLLEKKDYLWGFATATPDEALVLRRGGVKKPVLALGTVFPNQRQAMIENEVRMTVYTEEMAEHVSRLAVLLEKKAYVHIKLDTGMSRLGFPVNEESADTIMRISQMPNLILEGMYTHFAKADELDKTFTREQADAYLWMKNTLEERGLTFRFYHCSNSAGILDIPEVNLDLVRAGIATYGMYPSEDVMRKTAVPLRPALELVSHVGHVKWVDAGTPVSYGCTYITKRRTKIVTVPVGYADGYPRSLSNKGYVLIHGKMAKILGRVCMDQMMVDATLIEDVNFGDTVTLIGYDGDAHLPVEELSDLSGRFNYEFVCDLSKRIPREYYRHGELVQQVDHFR